MTKDDLGQRLKELRALRGLSLAEVAANAVRAGHKLSKPYVAQVENGQSDPTAAK